MPYGSSKTVWPPLGILSLAAVLREEKREIFVVDGILEGFDLDIPLDEHTFLMGLPPKDLAREILRHDPDVVGFSVLFMNQVDCALATARIIRNEAPDVFLLWGGPIPTLKPHEFGTGPEKDGLIFGEADLSAPMFLDELAQSGLKGNFPAGTGVRVPNGFRSDHSYQPVQDLDILPLPARDLVDMQRYMDKVKEFKVWPKSFPVTTIQTSRGCPNRCIFCSSPVLYRRKYRAFSPRRVIEEIDLLVERYSVSELMIVDENFSANPRRTEELIDLIIERGYQLTWFPMAGTHVMTLNERILEKMVRSGLYKLKVSFESGSERVLREVIKKPMDLHYGERMIKFAKSMGLPVGANFILGFPWETRADIMESYDFAKKLDLDFTLWSLASPYPYTELTERAKTEGLLPLEFDFSDLEPGRAYFDLPDVSREELERWWHEFWQDLNFPSPEKEARYYSYALPNPNYRPPKKPKPESTFKPLEEIDRNEAFC